MSYTLLTIDPLNILSLEDASFMLMSVGAATVTEKDNSLLECYCNQQDIQTIKEESLRLGFKIISENIIPDQNWTQKCREVLEPVKLKQLTITPILDLSEARPTLENEILLIPALGFGTGHHVTTFSILSLLEDFSIDNKSFNSVLDVGTGSGILALTAAKLFNAKCLALDNDLDALRNAEDNLAINNTLKNIIFSDKPLESIDQKFDLIIANIFAEVLIEMMPDFSRLLATDGTLIISGILAHKTNDILEAIEKILKKQVKKSILKDNWLTLLI